MKQAGRAAGATGWLVKPFDPARLLEVIKKVIKS
jgi:two-component system chemotaxis response regulator CheY